MHIINKRLDDIHPYAKNPRKNDAAVDPVAASIREFGFKVPIVIDKNGEIVAGHTRYKAAQKLGLSEVPCIVADDLTPEQIKAFRLADNKVSEAAEWDMELLGFELEELTDIDMSIFGFNGDEEAINGFFEWDEDEQPIGKEDPLEIHTFRVTCKTAKEGKILKTFAQKQGLQCEEIE